jgi:hypothetical protein
MYLWLIKSTCLQYKREESLLIIELHSPLQESHYLLKIRTPFINDLHFQIKKSGYFSVLGQGYKKSLCWVDKITWQLIFHSISYIIFSNVIVWLCLKDQKALCFLWLAKNNCKINVWSQNITFDKSTFDNIFPFGPKSFIS